MVHIKAYLCKLNGTVKEIRRVSVNQDVSWDGLAQLLQMLFGSQDWSLEYQDPENDSILIGSAEEWEECLRIGEAYTDIGKPLKLYVKKSKIGRRERSTSSNAPCLEIEPSHFYCTEPGEKMPEPQLLEDIQKTVPKVLGQFLSDNWESKDSLPEWLQPVLDIKWDLGGPTFDVKIDNLASALSTRAIRLMDEKKYEEALTLLKDALAVNPTCDKYYNIACCHALSGKSEEAFQALNEAAIKGYKNVSHLRSDPDLKSLEGDQRLNEIIQKIEGSMDSSSVTQSTPDNRPESPSVEVITEDSLLCQVVPSAPPCEVIQPDEKQTLLDDSTKYQEQLRSLQEMGFWDLKMTLEVLEQFNGHLPSVIESLLGRI